MRGGDGDDRLRVDAGEGDDVVRIEAGPGTDTITYDVSSGQDTAYIEGGSGVDTLTINRGVQNFTVFDQNGNILYKYGDGGTMITVVGIEQISIVAP